MSNNDKYAFIGYPLSWDLLLKQNPRLKGIPKEELENQLIQTPPFIVSDITGVVSKTGKTASGNMVLIYLLPDQILGMDGDFVLNKIIEAGKLAQKNGAEIVGLGGLTSVVGNQGEIVAKNLDIAVTTGNSYTAGMTAKATLKAAEIMEIDLSKSIVSIIGATGSIGSICSHIFAEKARKVVLVARNMKRLEDLASELREKYSAAIEIELDISKAVANSDIVITATSSPQALIDVKELKSGCVVCDVATPHNVAYKSRVLRKDILVIDGGMIKPPGKMKIEIDIGLPQGIAYACLSETMILTFEGRAENFSLGRGLNIDKVKEIMNLGEKHGFELSNFLSFGKVIVEDDIKRIRKSVRP